MSLVTEPGIYTMSAADYHADPCLAPSLSSSMIRALCTTTPAHARLLHPKLNPAAVEAEAEHLDIGELAHAILLEGVNVVEILDFQDWRTNASKDARNKARAERKIPLLRKVWNEVQAMTAATREHLDAHVDGRAMFRDGDPEQVLIWREQGIWCRARLDWLRPNAIDDYKTTSVSANPEQLSKTVFSNGWDIQAEFYRRGLKALTGIDAPFRFACQECFAPYALSVVSLAPGAEMLAEKKILFAMDIWRRCLETDDWPGYPLKTAYVTLPQWVENAWLQKETADAF